MKPETMERDLMAAMKELGVPEHDWDGLVAHVMTGRPVGSFLTSVLENNLMEACMRADNSNRHALPALAGVLYDHTPSGCHGSPERVRAWRENGGLEGLLAAVKDGVTGE